MDVYLVENISSALLLYSFRQTEGDEYSLLDIVEMKRVRADMKRDKYEELCMDRAKP